MAKVAMGKIYLRAVQKWDTCDNTYNKLEKAMIRLSTNRGTAKTTNKKVQQSKHSFRKWEKLVDKIYLKEGMTNSGVALDSDGKSKVDAACETHLSHRQEEGHLQISTLSYLIFVNCGTPPHSLSL